MADALSAWQIVLKGGPMMVPLLFISGMVLTIVIEKIMFFSSMMRTVRDLSRRVGEALDRHDVGQAARMCEESASPFAPILSAGMMCFGQGRHEVRKAMERSLRQQWPLLEERIGLLGALTVVAPVTGFLGTLLGLGSILHSLQSRAMVLDPLGVHEITGALWQALITTFVSFTITIFAVVAHADIFRRLKGVVLAMEEETLLIEEREPVGVVDVQADSLEEST